MDFKNKKIAIAGFGVEGKSIFKYLKSKGVLNKSVTVADSKKIDNLPKGVGFRIGDDAFDSLQDFDIVFRSPSIRPYRLMTDGKVWSSTNEFFANCPADVIGVTGTKGKGTTCSLVYEILKNAGYAAHLIGNIGKPVLDVLPKIKTDDIVVFELSSFQLWDVEYSPKVAIVLMVEPDHLDIHSSVDEYIEAKSRIVKYQTKANTTIRHPNNTMTSEVVLTAKSERISYMSEQGAYVKDDHIFIEDQPVCAVSDVGLLGEHNLENVCAAITAAWIYTQDISAIQKAVKSFKGLPHRLEFVKEVNAVKYYDDSFAAAPPAAVVASQSFDQPVVQILGGYDRDLDYSKFTQIAQNTKKIVLIGDNKDKIVNELESSGYSNFAIADSMKQAVDIAAEVADKGDVVLLSPGSPSFDWYNNYIERAADFRKKIDEL